MRALQIAPLFFLFSLARPGLALADVAPDCSSLDMYPGCDAAEVGKACDSKVPAAKCAELFCAGGTGNKAYKCVVSCKDVVPKGTGESCSPGQKACGVGTCKSYEESCYGNLYTRLYCDDGKAAGGAGGAASGEAGAAGSGSAEAGAAGAPAGVAGASAGGASSGGSGGAPTAPAPTADDSGCAVSAAGKRGLLASFVTVAGAAALFASRRRRQG